MSTVYSIETTDGSTVFSGISDFSEALKIGTAAAEERQERLKVVTSIDGRVYCYSYLDTKAYARENGLDGPDGTVGT